jgi:hypothetical protein
MNELLIEALEFFQPFAFGDQRLGADDQYRSNLAPGLEFLEDQAGLDGLADAHFVGDEQPRPVGLDQLEHRPELVGNEIDARGEQGIQVAGAGVTQLQGGKGRVQSGW